MNYKINNIEPSGIASVTLTLRDGSTYTDRMQNLPLGNKEELEAFLLKFATDLSDDQERTVEKDPTLQINKVVILAE